MMERAIKWTDEAASITPEMIDAVLAVKCKDDGVTWLAADEAPCVPGGEYG